MRFYIAIKDDEITSYGKTRDFDKIDITQKDSVKYFDSVNGFTVFVCDKIDNLTNQLKKRKYVFFIQVSSLSSNEQIQVNKISSFANISQKLDWKYIYIVYPYSINTYKKEKFNQNLFSEG